MLAFRIVLAVAAVVLGGLIVAYMVTKNRRYLTLAGQILMGAVSLLVLLGLLYLFERVFLL